MEVAEHHLVNAGLLLQQRLLQVKAARQLVRELTREGHAPGYRAKHAGGHLSRPCVEVVLWSWLVLQDAVLR